MHKQDALVQDSSVNERENAPCLRVMVYPHGHHEHMMAPEFVPMAAHSLRNLLLDAAGYAHGQLRKDLEHAAALLAKHDESARPPQPGPDYRWDDFAKQWYLPGAKGPAISPAR